MNKAVLKLSERTISGKKVARLRKDGNIPSIVYGKTVGSVSTQSPLVETLKIVRDAGRHTPIEIDLDGKKHLAIIKSIDIDPVKNTLQHVAFHTIKQNEKIVAEIPIELSGVGESAAERAGLVILQAIESVEVRALPANLPSAINVSVEKLATDEDKLTFNDISLPEGVEFADHELDLDLVIANVYEPSALQAANEAAGGEAEEDVASVESENGSEASDNVEES